MVWHDIKTNQVNKFFEQINQQSEFLKSKGLDINFNLVLLENGSKDNTNELPKSGVVLFFYIIGRDGPGRRHFV